MARRRTFSRTAVIGSTFVLALVAALPIALALVPAETFSSEAGAGAGTGDLTAAAVSSLDRDLQTNRTLPPHVRQTCSTFVSLVTIAGEEPGTHLQGCGRVLVPPPATWCAGPTDARHPLLL